MNCRRPVRLAVGLAGVLAGGLAGFAQGEASAPAPAEKATAAFDENAVSIDVATKEFESVKAMRQFGTEARPAAPRLSVPRLHTDSAPAAPVPRLRNELETTARGSNWLVEAM